MAEYNTYKELKTIVENDQGLTMAPDKLQKLLDLHMMYSNDKALEDKITQCIKAHGAVEKAKKKEEEEKKKYGKHGKGGKGSKDKKKLDPIQE